MACEVAFASKSRHLILFHHDPSYSDAMVAGMEVTAKAQFGETRAAYEGLEIILQNKTQIAKQLQSASLRPRSQRERRQWM
jgi:hypothetical protein